MNASTKSKQVLSNHVQFPITLDASNQVATAAEQL